MTEEKTILNELRRINIATKRCMSAFCDAETALPTMMSMAMHFVYMRGGDVPQKEVESEFNLRRSTASQLLGKLERSGYIVRASAAHDGRSKRISLTEKAKAESEKIMRRFHEAESYFEAALSAEEKQTFYLLSEKLCRHFESMSQRFTSPDERA